MKKNLTIKILAWASLLAGIIVGNLHGMERQRNKFYDCITDLKSKFDKGNLTIKNVIDLANGNLTGSWLTVDSSVWSGEAKSYKNAILNYAKSLLALDRDQLSVEKIENAIAGLALVYQGEQFMEYNQYKRELVAKLCPDDVVSEELYKLRQELFPSSLPQLDEKQPTLVSQKNQPLTVVVLERAGGPGIPTTSGGEDRLNDVAPLPDFATTNAQNDKETRARSLVPKLLKGAGLAVGVATVGKVLYDYLYDSIAKKEPTA
jgi:hypothetical protein